MAEFHAHDGRVCGELFSGAVGAGDGSEGEFCGAGRSLCGGVLFDCGVVGLGEEVEAAEWGFAVEDRVGLCHVREVLAGA